jgi:hypothetical protein
VLVGWFGATALGLVAAWPQQPRQPRQARPADHPDRAARPAARSARWEPAVVLAWAVGLAVLSLCVRRANPDDLYYVNLSQWVADHGSFPIRDTLFADLRWPMTSWPPIASYDALTRALAHPFGIKAGTLVYEVVPPLGTVAAVLATWRLLRTWRTPHAAWALTVAMGFLLLDGTESYASPGNLFMTRMWQGKVILLCVVVPLALVHALRYVERPDRRGLVRLAVTGTAAVACSTTAMFLMPVVAVAGMAPLVRRPRAALAGFAALAAYPLASGVATVALHGRSADDFGARELYRFDPEWIGHAVFLTYAVAFVGVLAVLLGPFTLPRPAARLTTAVVLLAVGVTLVPGVTRVAYDVSGLGPTLWRLTWGLTVGALVGVGAVRAWLAVRHRWPRRVLVVVAVAGCAAYGLAAPPTLARDTNTTFAAPLHWQRSAGSQEVVEWLTTNLPDGSVVLGSNTLSITLAVTTTRLKSVAPRDYFMARLAGQPGFDHDARLLLVRLANPQDRPAGWPLPARPAVRDAVERVGVRAACLDPEQRRAVSLLEGAGLQPAVSIGDYECLVRPGLD